MFNWIVIGILILWIFYMRGIKKIKVEEYPLALPRGTIRALTTLLIILFPLTFLYQGVKIPGLIINAIFILVAFYFEARKGESERLNQIICEIKDPDLTRLEEEKKYYPLYLPQYSVRISLIIILILTIYLSSIIFPGEIAFESTNTLIEIAIIIILFIIGTTFRAIKNRRKSKKITEKIKNMKNYLQMSDVEIIENIMKEKPKKWQLTGKGVFSVLMFLAINVGLLLYQFSLDFTYQLLPFYLFSLRETLLLLINVYYGFRD